MKKVIFFTYYMRHLKKLIPVIKALSRNEMITVYLMAFSKGEKELAERVGIKYFDLEEFTGSSPESEDDFSWVLQSLINAIDKIQPDLFIATEVNYILRNVIRYCKQRGIHNIIIQHGTPNRFSLQAFEPFEGECFLAWGDYTRDFLIENHVAPSRIIVTGGANFDQTLSLKSNKESIEQVLGADANKKWIVFTTQCTGAGNIPTEEEIFDGIAETARRIARYSEFQLIFQVHPSQKIENVKKIVDTVADNNSIVAKYADTEELMASSDGVITFFSTTAIDAVVMGKPLLLINLTEDKDFLPFAKEGAAFGAYTKEGISTQLDNLLFNSDLLADAQKRAALSVNYMNDGKALERILRVCYNKLDLE